MKRYFPLVLALALTFVVGFIASCMDEEPCEISAITSFNGEARACTVLLFNSKGAQIGEIPTDVNGIGYLKQLTAGKYLLKFCDTQRNMYPAEVEVVVSPGESLPVKIDLEKPPVVSGDTPPAQ